MESATFRKWLVEQGCRVDAPSEKHEGHGEITAHRNGRSTRIPLVGPRQALDPRVVQQACEQLGLDQAQLPGPSSRV